MDLIIATIGLGFLMSGVSTGRQMIEGSPLHFYPWHTKLFYAGSIIAILSLISGFFFFGAWWIGSILVAWLPLNYYIGRIFSNPAHAAMGLLVSVVLGTAMFGAGLAIAE
jgi:hypothetical protein